MRFPCISSIFLLFAIIAISSHLIEAAPSSRLIKRSSKLGSLGYKRAYHEMESLSTYLSKRNGGKEDNFKKSDLERRVPDDSNGEYCKTCRVQTN